MSNQSSTNVEQRVDALAAEVNELRNQQSFRRRALLGGLAGIGAVGAASQPAAAAKSPWNDGDGDGLLETDSSYSGIDVDSANIAAANGTGDTVRAQPFVDALRDGYIVGQGPHTHVVIDPRNYSTDADAIQQAHDDLVNLLDANRGAGIVWIPALDPNENELTITKTVTFDGDGSTNDIEVHPRGWGFFGRKSPTLQLDITDGSPAFECRNMKGQGSVIGGFRAQGANGGEDCEFLRLHNMTAWKYDLIEVRGIGGSSQNGVITFDAGCNNSLMNNTRYNSSFENVTEGNFLAFRDLESTGDSPSELKFGDGMSTYADPDYPYKHAIDVGSVGVGDLLFRGRYEGYGDHGIYGTKGTIQLGDGLELGRVEDNDGTGTSRVYFTGFEITISDGVIMASNNDTGGDNVHLEVGQGKIGAFTSDEPNGHVINIPNDTGANKLVVPREQAFEGTVSYPSTFNQLVYADGWQREDAGAVTVPTGGAVRIGNWLGKSDKSLRVNTRLEDPGEDVFYSKEYGFDSGNQQSIRLVDQQSSSDYLVDYEVEIKAE